MSLPDRLAAAGRFRSTAGRFWCTARWLWCTALWLAAATQLVLQVREQTALLGTRIAAGWLWSTASWLWSAAGWLWSAAAWFWSTARRLAAAVQLVLQLREQAALTTARIAAGWLWSTAGRLRSTTGRFRCTATTVRVEAEHTGLGAGGSGEDHTDNQQRRESKTGIHREDSNLTQFTTRKNKLLRANPMNAPGEQNPVLAIIHTSNFPWLGTINRYRQPKTEPSIKMPKLCSRSKLSVRVVTDDMAVLSLGLYDAANWPLWRSHTLVRNPLLDSGSSTSLCTLGRGRGSMTHTTSTFTAGRGKKYDSHERSAADLFRFRQ